MVGNIENIYPGKKNYEILTVHILILCREVKRRKISFVFLSVSFLLGAGKEPSKRLLITP